MDILKMSKAEALSLGAEYMAGSTNLTNQDVVELRFMYKKHNITERMLNTRMKVQSYISR